MGRVRGRGDEGFFRGMFLLMVGVDDCIGVCVGFVAE